MPLAGWLGLPLRGELQLELLDGAGAARREREPWTLAGGSIADGYDLAVLGVLRGAVLRPGVPHNAAEHEHNDADTQPPAALHEVQVTEACHAYLPMSPSRFAVIQE